MEGLSADPKEVEAYNKILVDRPIKKSKMKDELIWVVANDGKYRVKDGYKALLHSQSWDRVDIPLKLCWDMACLPKVGFFLWLAFQNRISTADRLGKFSIQGSSRCILCKENSKDMDHLLHNCLF